jgi:hypothetical protein
MLQVTLFHISILVFDIQNFRSLMHTSVARQVYVTSSKNAKMFQVFPLSNLVLVAERLPSDISVLKDSKRV